MPVNKGAQPRHELKERWSTSRRALTALRCCLSTIRTASREQELLQGVCDTLWQEGEFRLVWVGVRATDEREMWSGLAVAGDSMILYDWALASLNGLADLLASGSVKRHRHEAMLAMPFELEGGQAVLMLVSDDVNRFDDQEVAWLRELAGCVSTRSTAMREQAQKLGVALEETITAIRTLGELRDPYTAGHERRVGDLAAEIGRILGLTADQQAGLRVAGYLHDIGKIVIPSELLSKPSALTSLEQALLQSHAQAGYDILKAVHFPWPVALPVLQHHERLDGSGYPNGLQGDAICLEARILGVADVVEAMASHRPYRPALGLHAAMAELRAGRGRRYDAEVVDACLQVFEWRDREGESWHSAGTTDDFLSPGA